MSLFDQLVTEAIKNQPQFSSLRVVVEKELLHHDILRELSKSALLAGLTFIGGTCLRSCYGGIRLSEDLDFTGGADFTRDTLYSLGDILVSTLNQKYGLIVKVTEPVKDSGNLDTWKVKIETRPEHHHLPAQRINIDICAIPSYEKRPMLLLNPYGVDMGTTGLIIQAQSKEEIYTDKIIAFALRPNRVKYRDLWDMIWLHQQACKPNLHLIPQKLQDRNCKLNEFFTLFNDRRQLLANSKNASIEFEKEMQRFLPISQVAESMQQSHIWNFILYLLEDISHQMLNIFNV